MRAQSLQPWPTLCDPMDCSPPGSTVCGILQPRMLEWVALSSSRGSSHPRDQIRRSCDSCFGRQILYPLSHPLGKPRESMNCKQRSCVTRTKIHVLQLRPKTVKYINILKIYKKLGSWFLPGSGFQSSCLSLISFWESHPLCVDMMLHSERNGSLNDTWCLGWGVVGK